MLHLQKMTILPLSTFLVTYTKPSSSITMPTGELIWPEEVYKPSTCHKHGHTVISTVTYISKLIRINTDAMKNV